MPKKGTCLESQSIWSDPRNMDALARFIVREDKAIAAVDTYAVRLGIWERGDSLSVDRFFGLIGNYLVLKHNLARLVSYHMPVVQIADILRRDCEAEALKGALSRFPVMDPAGDLKRGDQAGKLPGGGQGGETAVPPTMQRRMIGVFERLRSFPDVSGAKPLRGKLAGRFRIRTGDYRVQFRIEGNRVVVEKVGHRDRFY